MSRDIFVQDLPSDIDTVEDIPDGWMPQPLPFDADGVRAAVLALAPDADFSDPSWGHVVLPGADIEVNIGDEEPLQSFALHVRSADEAAVREFVGPLLQRLGVRAIDGEGAPATGIFGKG